MEKPSDSKLVFIKISKVISYIIYTYVIIACIFLGFGFFLLLFGANPSTPFVEFVYRGASDFLQPFRGIFPTHQFGDSGYFSPAILFAIIVYLMFALAVNSLIAFINNKLYKHQAELEQAMAKDSKTATKK